MPIAHQGEVKYHYQDHDTDVVNEAPPVLNQWYTVFDADDVRLLYCMVTQTNDETNAKDLEVRWTIDGNVYFAVVNNDNNAEFYIFRVIWPSTGGTSGLDSIDTVRHGALYLDKRGMSFKVEVRITSALGTNQTLTAYAVRETLEQT